MEKNKKLGGIAFLPILVFVVLYIGAGLYFESKGVEFAFYQFPSVVSMFIAIIIGFLMTKGKVEEKFSIYARGIGKEGVVTMLLVYMLAGAFSGIATAMGGRDATVNLGLSIIPAHFLGAGVFVISAFMGTATGTSIGTITAVAPIAIGIAAKGGLSVPMIVGACVGGAMFGDNLSMISDTTIAATKSQNVEMKDKFRVNFLIALPAAICTIIALLIFSKPVASADMGDLSYNLWKVLPYLLVFVLAILGVNVFVVLSSGIVVAMIIGVATGSFDVATAAQSIWSGVTGMDEIYYLTMLMAGLSEIVRHNGGIDWLVAKFSGAIKSAKSAQVVLGILAMLLDFATATNTVAIIIEGDVAKEVSRKYRIDPRRTASVLDIFSCVAQGFLPYSGQLLLSAGFATAAGLHFTAINFMPFVWYNMFLALFGILSMFLPFADGVCRRDPWNWEKDCPQSKVAK